MNQPSVAVVIPCYQVSRQIDAVLQQIGGDVDRIYVVDDACPEGSGKQVVLYNHRNLGVGGAVIAGYREALKDNMDIVVKLDGDGQMDPREITRLIKPIIKGQADYTKGNRFFSYEHMGNMPLLRLLGNGALSFLSKLSSGYWNIVDPTNGYIAIHKIALKQLPLDKINNGYFFESDLLFRLNSIRATVIDVPIKAIYGDETSNLKEHQVLLPFLAGHCRNFIKRIAYNYFIRDVSFATLEMIFGLLFMVFGLTYGGINWIAFIAADTYAPGGVVMLSALTIILGMQLLLSAINYDIQSVPKWPLQMLQDDA